MKEFYYQYDKIAGMSGFGTACIRSDHHLARGRVVLSLPLYRAIPAFRFGSSRTALSVLVALRDRSEVRTSNGSVYFSRTSIWAGAHAA
jgi:hypothetical protein